LITFVGAVPLEVDAVGGEAAIERSFKGSEDHFAVSIGIDDDEGGPDQVEMGSIPCTGLDDPPLADSAVHDFCHQLASSSLGSRTRL
jgi:hypothetical protein